MKKFDQGDIIHSRMKTLPQSTFRIVGSGDVVYDNRTRNEDAVPYEGESLYEINTDRSGSQLIYPYKVKDSTRTYFNTITSTEYDQFEYGDIITGSYPLTSSIYFHHFCDTGSRPPVTALRNVMESYLPLSRHYAYSSSLGDKSTMEMTLIEIPSIFYGSSLKKGSVSLRFFVDGSKYELRDVYENGELYQLSGTNSGSIAGTVLYREGFIMLTGSWELDSTYLNDFRADCSGTTSVHPAWRYFGKELPDDSAAYEVSFKGINYIDTLTMMCHAEVGEINHSNNPTFLEKGQTLVKKSTSAGYVENDKLAIKNVEKSPYSNTDADFKKVTYISKVAIMDERGEVIAIAKLATPLKKTESRNYTVKLKLDL